MKKQFHPAGHLVVGLSGRVLRTDERLWIMEHKPAGVILFSRNLGPLDELVDLVNAIRKTTTPSPTLWLDQEGGRVQRLRTPLTRYPTAESLADLDGHNPEKAMEVGRLWGQLCGQELHSLGFGVNCAPVLDLREPGAHHVIGDRAFGTHPEQIIRLAGAWLSGFSTSGCMAVGKHFPGHGAAMVDSHRQLPVIDKDLQQLENRELSPFKHLAPKLPALMTAHLIAKGLDPEQPATWSSKLLLDLLRNQWGYRGLLVSDAIEMEALEGSIEERTKKAVLAGCDLILCCTGRIDDNESARLGVIAALEQIPTQGKGPFFNAEKINRYLNDYRIQPGNWRQLLADPNYQDNRKRVEALSSPPMGADPTEAGH